ncbi:MAG: hypothetical protein MJ108_06545 [Saccharofermentans sp.]|nr:hypothetical protein [Saccharofermentans sp.]
MEIRCLEAYKSIIVDYSIIREFGGTSLFRDFLDIVVSTNKDVYVSKSFKLLHYCVIHQADRKYAYVADAMRDFCAVLLPNRQLHSVQATDTVEFLDKVKDVENACLVITEHSIFTKRILDLKPDFKGDICVISKAGCEIYNGVEDLVANLPVPVISPLASVNKYLDAPVYCNVGDEVQTGRKTTVTLTKRISSGAEGMVFNTDNPKVVAKIYHKGVITPLRWSKLQQMVSMGINSVGICWPQDLIYYRNVPVGYTMIIGKGRTLGNVFDGPDAITNSFPEWKRSDIVDTLIDLIEKYLYLHMHDIIAGDIQMKNALLYSSNSVYLIDMDSVQVGNLPCPVGTEEFTDPALWGQNFSGFLRKLKDEDYSIAMLVFSILFCGLHPYATRMGAETLREEILEKNFPYLLDNSSDEHIPRGGYNYIWEYLPEQIRTMLYGVFKEGKKYEAIVWYEAVVNYKEMLTSHKFEDEEAYKVFPKMDYKPTIETPEQTAEVLKNASYKSRFSGLNSAVYQPAPLVNPNANNANTATSGVGSGAGAASSPFAPKKTTSPFAINTPDAFAKKEENSPFVPKGAAPSNSGAKPVTPPAGNKEEEKGGLLGKFKKGLFG